MQRLHRAVITVSALLSLALVAAGCASRAPQQAATPQVKVPPTGIYKVGNPYQQDGVWYYPQEEPDYDETGVASWYGAEFHGRRTANGEIFHAGSLTAAHRTLPMPVNVRVTNLSNGRSLMLRVNDRGPFSRGRIIDVSDRAAELLGFKNQGTARVRVTYMGRAPLGGSGGDFGDDTPPEIARAVPAAPAAKVDMAALDIVPGAVAAPVQSNELPSLRPASPAAPAPSEEVTGQLTQFEVPKVTHLYVQAGAFSSYDNAVRMRTRLGSAGGVRIAPLTRGGQTLHRVRLGPYDDLSSADAALARVISLGINDAKIVVDQ